LSPRLDRLELSLNGRMGPKSVEWLSDTLKVPETYAIRAPLEISDARLSWQPDATTSFKGLVSIEKGPAITVHVDYQPGQLQVHRLNIKDRHSDADMVFERDESHRDFKFTGNLYHETLQAIFVDHLLSSGRLEGDFTVTVPTNGQTGVTTSGRLSAENLPVHLSSEDKMNIERITLRADGQQVTADISKLTWKELVWEPVKGTVSFNNDRVDVRLAETKLCGINALGLLSFAGDDLSLDLTLDGKDLDVATSYTCLTEGRVKATGSLDFSSRVTAQGPTDQLLENLRGPLEMTFSNGVIERDKLVSRILEVLNVTEIVKGRLPDLGSTGFAYTTITLRGRFQDGNLIIDEFFMDGETLTLVGSGEIDLDKRTLDAQLLAAPFKTIDTIVKYLPGINYLLGGSLVAIPVGVSGSLDDPSVMVLSPTAIGSSIYNLAERAITSPFKLFKKIILWGSGDYETVAPPDGQSDR
jgi:hypothetical protein